VFDEVKNCQRSASARSTLAVSFKQCASGALQSAGYRQSLEARVVGYGNPQAAWLVVL
jgi:hypothetical protein